MSLPPALLAVLATFRSAFTAPTWRKVVVLLVGAVLAPGRRTVTAALRQTGHQAAPHFSTFHHVLNRARWSALQVSHLLVQLLVQTFLGPDAALTLAIDETLERRQGWHITKRGFYRDGVRSTHDHAQISGGLRWITLALLITPPWTRRCWALPFLSVLAPTPKVSALLGHRHKTVPELAAQMVALVRRWLPSSPITLVGDGAYSVLDLGHTCGQHHVTLIAPLRLDAGLYTPPPPRRLHQEGRPRIIGQRLPTLDQVLTDPTTVWTREDVRWYDGQPQRIAWCSGTALWYRAGKRPLPIRWVLSKELPGKRAPRAFFSTDPTQTGSQIIASFIARWAIEVTFEESRAHLGLETQRQWSATAIDRTTPCLLGLYSLITLWGQALCPQADPPVQQSAWYKNEQATFSDILALVRRQLWDPERYSPLSDDPEYVKIPRADLTALMERLCYAA
jgi:hypothetical protein